MGIFTAEILLMLYNLIFIFFYEIKLWSYFTTLHVVQHLIERRLVFEIFIIKKNHNISWYGIEQTTHCVN